MTEEDDSLSKQLLNMILENSAVFTFITGYLIFNIIILALLIYISIRISLR